jgi:hypothetical protein
MEPPSDLQYRVPSTQCLVSERQQCVGVEMFFGTRYQVLGTHNPNSSRSLFVCARLTGISLCFLSSMRS